MATLNTSHHPDGGVLLYQGELILLYCDQVQCDVAQKDSVKGRIYLTTHRILFTAQPLKQSRVLQSLAAPFGALFDMSLEQPVFGANYIKGKLRTDSSGNTSATDQNMYQFKLKFNRGGAIEFGQALREASRRVPNASSASSSFPPQAPDASAFAANQFYQAPDSVYQPNYPVGFALPTHIFSQAPPPGFVYMYQAPPPYPGLSTAASEQQQQQQQQPYPSPYPTITAYAPAYVPQNVGLGSSVEYPLYPQAQAQFQPIPAYPNYPSYPPPPNSGPNSAPNAAPYPPGPQPAGTQGSSGPPNYPAYPNADYSASGPQTGAPPGYTPSDTNKEKK